MSDATEGETPTPVVTDVPEFPIGGDGFTEFFNHMHAKIKTWVRQELMLHASGKTEDERKAENP